MANLGPFARIRPGSMDDPKKMDEEQKRREEKVAKSVAAARAPKSSDSASNDSFTPVEYDPQYILMVNGLKKYFAVKSNVLGCRRSYLQPEAWHHHGLSRRVRLRQDHHRPGDSAAVR